MKTSVLVFVGMTSAFLAESCQGDRTQGQQCSKNREKYIRSALGVARYIVATETGGQMRAVVYYSARLRKSDHERAKDLHCDAQILPQ
jgi:hypothetical protein